MKAQVINLLPEEKIRILNIERINAVTTLAAGVAGVVILGSIIVLLVVIGGLKAGQAALSGDIQKSNREIAALNKLKDDPAKLEDQARILQSQLAVIKTILDTKAQVRFASALERLSKIVPADVSFNQADINDQHVVTITGRARTYASVGRFAEALKSDGRLINAPSGQEPVSYFRNVSITSSSFNEADAAVNYSITFTLGEETFHARS